jgi:hypothetical protein
VIGGGQPTRVPAETSVPAMQEILSHARRREADDRDLTWAEDDVSRWRALALFGVLAFVEGVILTTETTGAAGFRLGGPLLLALAVVITVVGILILPAFGAAYVWGVLGAGGLAFGLGIYYYQYQVLYPYSAAPSWPGSLLLYGGSVAFVVGLALSLLVGRRSNEE